MTVELESCDGVKATSFTMEWFGMEPKLFGMTFVLKVFCDSGRGRYANSLEVMVYFLLPMMLLVLLDFFSFKY